MTNVEQVLARAHSAAGRSTLYWLGQGGKDPRAPFPSSGLSIAREWLNIIKLACALTGLCEFDDDGITDAYRTTAGWHAPLHCGT